jgi:hypothetical protein
VAFSAGSVYVADGVEGQAGRRRSGHRGQAAQAAGRGGRPGGSIEIADTDNGLIRTVTG